MQQLAAKVLFLDTFRPDRLGLDGPKGAVGIRQQYREATASALRQYRLTRLAPPRFDLIRATRRLIDAMQYDHNQFKIAQLNCDDKEAARGEKGAHMFLGKTNLRV
jgi:hypothetical protein